MRSTIGFFVVMVSIIALKRYFPDWELIAIATYLLIACWSAPIAFRRAGIPLGWMFYVGMIMLTALYAGYVVMYAPLSLG